MVGHADGCGQSPGHAVNSIRVQTRKTSDNGPNSTTTCFFFYLVNKDKIPDFALVYFGIFLLIGALVFFKFPYNCFLSFLHFMYSGLYENTNPLPQPFCQAWCYLKYIIIEYTIDNIIVIILTLIRYISYIYGCFLCHS